MIPLLTNHRTVTPEIMDRPDISEAAHLDALEGLRKINKASRTTEQILAPILAMARRRNLTKISLLDIACGGGDVPIGVATRAKSVGLEIELTLADRSATALHGAADAAKQANLACRTIELDVSRPWPELSADVVTCSLFLHHLEQPQQIVDFLSRIKRIARGQIVISDLRRSRIGYLIAYFGGRILSRSKVVHHDAPVSVRAAWTIAEISAFAAEARLDRAIITRSFPWRMLLTWEPA